MGTRTPLVITLWLLLPVAAFGQINNAAYEDYFLVGRFGEVCTMCEVVVLCEAGNETPAYEVIPDDGAFTLYYLQTRTFWSQISTIWEWFIVNFTSDALAAQGHTRPVWVYEINDGNWADRATIEGRLILDPGIIELGNTSIDRINQQWSGDGNPIGYCQRMPLWESIETIQTHAAGNAP